MYSNIGIGVSGGDMYYVQIENITRYVYILCMII